MSYQAQFIVGSMELIKWTNKVSVFGSRIQDREAALTNYHLLRSQAELERVHEFRFIRVQASSRDVIKAI